MSFANSPILTMMANKMEWLSRRTELLAKNVANVDTPEYESQDLKEVGFADLLDKTQAAAQPRVTNANHMVGTTALNGPFRSVDVVDKGAANLNGNTVSMEAQLVKLSGTQNDYQMTLNLYRKHMDMLRMAIGRASR